MVIYFKIIQRNLQFIMDGTHEDLFSLSNGPISPVFYASLARAGYFDNKELSNFRKINSPLPKNIFQESEMSMVHLVRA
jgi:transketolase